MTCVFDRAEDGQRCLWLCCCMCMCGKLFFRTASHLRCVNVGPLCSGSSSCVCCCGNVAMELDGSLQCDFSLMCASLPLCFLVFPDLICDVVCAVCCLVRSPCCCILCLVGHWLWNCTGGLLKHSSSVAHRDRERNPRSRLHTRLTSCCFFFFLRL